MTGLCCFPFGFTYFGDTWLEEGQPGIRIEGTAFDDTPRSRFKNTFSCSLQFKSTFFSSLRFTLGFRFIPLFPLPGILVSVASTGLL